MAHFNKVARQFVTKNMDAVATNVVQQTARDEMNGWQPDTTVVEAAVARAAVANVKGTVERAVEHNLRETRNMLPPLRHVMANIVRNNLTHLCPVRGIEHRVGKQFARSNHFQTWLASITFRHDQRQWSANPRSWRRDWIRRQNGNGRM